MEEAIPLQFLKIFGGVVQSIGMIDSQSCNFTLFNKSKNQLVGLYKDPWIFHPYCGKVINIKKSPVIYFIGCHTPVGKSVYLFVKKFVEIIKTLSLTFCPIEYLYVFIYECLNLRTFVVKIPQTLLYNLLFTVSFGNLFRIFFRIF